MRVYTVSRGSAVSGVTGGKRRPFWAFFYPVLIRGNISPATVIHYHPPPSERRPHPPHRECLRIFIFGKTGILPGQRPDRGVPGPLPASIGTVPEGIAYLVQVRGETANTDKGFPAGNGRGCRHAVPDTVEEVRLVRVRAGGGDQPPAG